MVRVGPGGSGFAADAVEVTVEVVRVGGDDHKLAIGYVTAVEVASSCDGRDAHTRVGGVAGIRRWGAGGDDWCDPGGRYRCLTGGQFMVAAARVR